MNIRDLEYLVALAEHRHFRRAASSCHVSQPTLSAQLRKLEETLGLQLLECQAAGMPLVTTDAGPMNEYSPLRAIPIRGSEVVCVGGGPILSQLIDPQDLLATLEPLLNTDIREASRRAREFVVRNHSWSMARTILDQAMTTR